MAQPSVSRRHDTHRLAVRIPASRPLRRELLDFLLVREHDPAVLDAVLHAL